MLTPIIILCLLCSPLGLAFLYCKLNNQVLDINKYASWGLAIAFIFFFIGHLVKTDAMTEMLPAWLPFKVSIIYFTGALELLVAMALFKKNIRSIAAIFAIAIFVLFFPANIYAALNSTGLGGHQWGPAYLLIRAPLQIILIAWAYFLCVKKH